MSVVINSQTGSRNPWLVCSRSKPTARVRLFCFPPAGANATLFHSWGKDAPDEMEVWSVQLPGRGYRLREAPCTDLAHLVPVLTEALWEHLAGHPFIFFGHSLGALLSFEVARALRQRCRAPAILFVAGRRPPHVPPDHALSRQPDAVLIRTLRRYGGTPEAVLNDPELMALVLPTFRADLRLNETYVSTLQPPLECPIIAFGGLGDDTVTNEELAAWQVHTESRFSLHMLPGPHMFIIEARAQLLRLMTQELGSQH